MVEARSRTAVRTLVKPRLEAVPPRVLSLVGPDPGGQDVLIASFRAPILFVAERALFTSHQRLRIRSATKHPADSAGARLRGLFRGHGSDYRAMAAVTGPALLRSNSPIWFSVPPPFE